MSKIHAVCPSCGAVNAVLREKMEQEPVCGRCRDRLLPGMPVILTDKSFDRYIAKSGLPVLVDFWAPWCGPCKMMAPAFEQAAAELNPAVILAKVDTQEEQVTAAKFQIQSIPTLVLFKNGREAARMSGAMQTPQIVSWARQHLG